MGGSFWVSESIETTIERKIRDREVGVADFINKKRGRSRVL